MHSLHIKQRTKTGLRLCQNHLGCFYWASLFLSNAIHFHALYHLFFQSSMRMNIFFTIIIINNRTKIVSKSFGIPFVVLHYHYPMQSIPMPYITYYLLFSIKDVDEFFLHYRHHHHHHQSIYIENEV